MRYARAAAEEALTLAAPEEAAALVRRALETADLGEVDPTARAELQLLLARSVDATGAHQEARTIVGDVFDRMLGAGDLDLACEAALEYGGYAGLWDAYGDDRGVAQLRTVLDRLPAGDSETRSMLLGRLAQWLLSAPGDESGRVARDAYDMAIRLGGDAARVEAALNLSWALRIVDPVTSLRFCDEGLEVATAGLFRNRRSSFLNTRADNLLALGDLTGVDRALEAAHEEAEAVGLARLDSYGPLWVMVRAQIVGRLDDSLAAADALEAFPTEAMTPLLWAALGRAEVAFLRGDWTDAASWSVEAHRRAPAMMDPYLTYDHLRASPAEIRSILDRWREIEPAIPAWARPVSIVVVADLLRVLDEGAAARALAEEFADHSGQFVTNGVCYFHGAWDGALGVLWATAGDHDRAVDHLQRAVDQCDAIEAAPFGVIARLELATAARLRGGDGDEELSRTVATEARRVAEEIGMPGWLVRLDRLDAGDPEPWREYGR